ncbi:SusD/RagB family nutrient-binding outer membrane lipoprotein [Chitinophaga cymbidii]|uniref:SusD/RagB family nutrient-binding outer membrane lipoprotein n=1 Tax=Chitinophaga cymbidii TaxID=1096750 RepID=A0A512RL81_9BACT|nr:SusD/RagB family nutrient-binding outer membrane lipoprotein [Chitinophaga cymbidii]GEP96464.1 hypothetical protein CCY01nite_27240 [Chitinophaga cymbidii]
MKKILFILLSIALWGTSCSKKEFRDSYTDPSKVATSSVEKQYAGMIYASREYVVPSYWNYFVILRITLNRFTQAVGWENVDNQYVPGAAAVTDRWNNYYNVLAQYRELEKVYNALPAEDQSNMRIYMITATIYFYDLTQRVVDLHGGVPWSEAGMLSTNGGNYQNSYPKYDDATAIYTKMLDDLKGFADELGTVTIPAALVARFESMDLVNNGDLTLWKKYCNSLRLRMLTRVSGAANFQARAGTEIAQILGNAASYPLPKTNAENIRIDIFDLNTDLNAKGFRTGLEDWNGNIAGKVMIDHMKANSDPRLRAMFEPGANAGGVYNGLDPMAARSTQNALIAGGTMAIYNRSTLSRNEFFPGILMTGAEVNFMLSEYYLKAGNPVSARTAYEDGIKESIKYYYWLRTLSNDNTAGALTPYTDPEVAAYLVAPGVNWTLALTDADKLKLIARQKWLHYSVLQPTESWAEIRRLDAPTFSFEVDNANAQKQPPMRWQYPASEATYNTANYEAVQANDKLGTKLFWDTQ